MNEDPRLRVVLVANYEADGQPSMQRFAGLLQQELAAQGLDVETWRPPAILGGRGTGQRGVQKWLGYADKFVLYPPRLRQAARRSARTPTIVHVCDHSNAIYVPWIRDVPHVVTCHDLLAVRRALGEFPGESTRWSGRRLQQMIRRGLRQSACIVSDSEATRSDVRRLVGGTHKNAVIHPAVAAAFTRQSPGDALDRMIRLRPDTRVAVDWPRMALRPCLLHVGGDQWYKNRAGLIDIYSALVGRMPDAPPLVLVGKPLTGELMDAICARGLGDRIAAFSGVTDLDLAALYSSAALLLFPSLAEGFGWPVAEAMACGCRVVTSGRAPMTEIAGDAATYIDPEDHATAAATVERVLNESDADRKARVAAGLARAARFSGRAMATAYLAVYREVLGARPNAA
jgi:glycosyltransferase involved in cell wall biosynthesis